MIAKNRIINLISTGFFLLINIIFLVKYGSRYSGHYLLITFSYLVFQLAIITIIEKYVPGNHSLKNKTKFNLLIVPLFLGYSALLYFAPAETRVSRADAAITWLSDLTAGIFPYGSQVNPSGFPVNFLLMLPLYLMGNIGILQIITFTGFALLIIYYSKTLKELLFRGFIFISSVPLFYELTVKSEIFSNMFFVALLSVFILKKESENKVTAGFIVSSVLFGFLLSTRLTVLPVLMILVLYKFRQNFKLIFYFLAISVLTFAATLLPFIIWNPELFFSRGPFSIQSIYLHPAMMLIILLIAVYTGWAAANKYELFFGTGLVLFLAVMASMFSTVSVEGLYNSLFGDRFDISYFIFCVPYFLLGMYEYKVDYFLGKIMPVDEND